MKITDSLTAFTKKIYLTLLLIKRNTLSIIFNYIFVELRLLNLLLVHLLFFLNVLVNTSEIAGLSR